MDAENQEWQKLLIDYVKACHEDFLFMQSCRLKSPKLSFLAQHGCDLVLTKHTSLLGRITNTVSTLGDAIEWSILSESDDRVFVEILDQSLPPVHLQSPFEDTRLVFKRLEGEWRIADILRRCISCNLSTRYREPGICFYCKGGEAEAYLGRCKYCNGTGKCEACCESECQGWVTKAD